MIERIQLQVVKNRILEPNGFIQVVFGPRQVGKTTMVLQVCKQIGIPNHYVSADAVGNTGALWIEQQWELARLRSKQEGGCPFLLVIDEIQKITNWSETVKKMWDADRVASLPIKIILLGSSRLLLQRGLTESLAGRFETCYLGHWSFREMKEAFGLELDQFMWFGGYPGSASLMQDEYRWKKYISDSLIESSISKDILMLTRIDKPALLKRLFELGCNYSTQELSFTKMLGQLQDVGNTVTLSHYLETLNSAGLLAGIEKYAVGAARKRSSSPKFLVHNTALISAQMPETFEQMREQPKQWGRIVESAIGAHLLNASVSEGFDVYYWRQGNDEVDFVLVIKNRIIALEVKSNSKNHGSGMASFQKQFAPNAVYLIGDQGIPLSDFLMMNPADL